MSGLEKIVDRISGEADEKAGAILAEAQARVGQISADNDRRVKEECERIKKKADTKALNIAERSKASAELKSKQILLSGRQEILNETIGIARKKLAGLSDQEYRDYFIKLFKKHVPTEDAVLRLGEKDLGRLTQEDISELKAAAQAAGSRLTVAEKAADIRDGFILDFGGVEENCTFDALFDQYSEDLLDKVKTILFA
ncbi:MAG: V-type ATP synthase subunit E [Clostridiales bacterium]|nr:V-type ATP synthase subunit E [Clostridiales bacterium]MDO5141034.1 V-type ATP synthase subunit E [Eubacteriales bacterium]